MKQILLPLLLAISINATAQTASGDSLLGAYVLIQPVKVRFDDTLKAEALFCTIDYDLKSKCGITWQLTTFTPNRDANGVVISHACNILTSGKITIEVDPTAINISTLNNFIFSTIANLKGLTLK